MCSFNESEGSCEFVSLNFLRVEPGHIPSDNWLLKEEASTRLITLVVTIIRPLKAPGMHNYGAGMNASPKENYQSKEKIHFRTVDLHFD